MTTDPLLQLEAYLQALPVAAYVCAPDGLILNFNNAARVLWGTEPRKDCGDHRFVGPLQISPEQSPKALEAYQCLRRAISDFQSISELPLWSQAKGERLLLQFSVSPLSAAGLTTDASLVLVNRVSLESHSEEVDHRASSLHETIIRTAAEGICVCSAIEEFPYTRFTVWNDRMTEITGYTMDEINQLGWYQTMYPNEEVQRQAIERMSQMRVGMDLRSEKWVVTRKDGAQRQLAISTSVVEIEHQAAVVAMMQDVTEEYAYKVALQENEQRLKLAVEATQLGPWDWNLQTNEVYFSPEWKEQLGYDSQELEGTYTEWEQRLHPEDKSQVKYVLQNYIDGQRPDYELEFRMRHKDGSYRWIYTRGVLHRGSNGQPSRMLGCHLDVTERKRTEDTLRQILQSVGSTTGQEYFRKLVDYLCDVCQVDLAFIAELDPENRFQVESLAYSRAGVPMEDFSYDIRNTPCASLWESDGPCHIRDVQHKFPHDSTLGENAIQEYIGIPLWGSSGNPIGLLAMLSRSPIEDSERAKSILQVVGARCAAELERHRAEAAVHQSEYRLTSIASTMPQALYVFNLQTLETEFQNRSLAVDLGYSPEEMDELGPDVLGNLLHPEDATLMPGLLKRWETAEDGEVLETEYRMRHKSGEWRWYVGRDTVYERAANGDVKTIIGTAQDVTHRKQSEHQRQLLEKQVQRAQKLESLGILAGGIAHDFNNLLTSVLGFADLALMSLPPDSQAADFINQAIRGAKNAAELTSQMLAYSGKGKFHMRPINLSQVVSETSRLLQVSISKNCLLSLDLDADLPPCDGDVSQLRQVIMNLMINASEAIGDSEGVITIKTSRSELTPSTTVQNFTGEPLEPGEYVCLTVSDTGCGMDEETRQRLFDPFFTTKFSGRGLGMSAVLGIVRGHHGAIEVLSQAGQGSIFRVYFPRATEPAPQLASQTPSAQQWRGQGTVLLADDESSIRSSTTELLITLGFEVITACDGREALQKYLENTKKIDVVLLDLTMPAMNGTQACTEIRRICATAKVILMSGYSEEANHQDFARCGASAFLQKPFRADALRNTLQLVASSPKG